MARYEELLRLAAGDVAEAVTSLETAAELSAIYDAAARFARLGGDTVRAAGFQMPRLQLWRDWARKLPGNAAGAAAWQPKRPAGNPFNFSR